MKPLKHFGSIAPFALFPILWLTRKKRKGLVALLLLSVALAGCFQYYYKTNTRNRISAFEIQQLQAANKYFIVHFRDTAVALANVTLMDEKIEGTMVQLLPEHKKYLDPDATTKYTQTTRFSPIKKRYRVKSTDRNSTLMEVHLYADENIQENQNRLSLPVSSFKRIDVYELDQQATTSNHVLSIVGGVVVVGFVVGMIAFLIACNCPQVYVDNGGSYQFVSGVYSGAIYSSLERTDYLPLLVSGTADNVFKMKIKNVKDEEQFMNRVQLLQVTHSAQTDVLVDRHGKIVAFKQLKEPLSAIINKNTDVKRQIITVDEDAYAFNSEKDEHGLSSIALTFTKPAGAKKAKLLVHAGNSSWSGYLYHSFAQLFGNGYEKWKAEKDKSDPKEMEKWQTDQGLPLMVYVQENGQWKFADYFAHTGNTASRDMIMELDVANVPSGVVKIKLASAYQFWNIDFAAMDFSENENITGVLLDASKALRSTNADEAENLNSVDNRYTYLNPEEEIDLEYKAGLPKDGEVNSYFLVSTGYYHSLRKYQGAPDIGALLKFKNRNAFDDYSRQKFGELQKSLDSYSYNTRK